MTAAPTQPNTDAHPRPSVVFGHLRPDAATGFNHASAIRRVNSEPIVGLLLLRALTMEVAHAKVGAGVSHHSSFTDHPLRRGWATADVGLRLVWGGPDAARAAARQVYRFHDHVHGQLPEPNPAWPTGDSYTAHDASLLLWVWATLVDATEVAHARWLKPLDGARGDAYYADMRRFARFFGIPSDLVPPDRRAFAEYFEAMVAGDELMPTPTSMAVVHKVLWFSHRNVPPFAARVGRVLAIATLDRRIRERFDLDLSTADRRLFAALDSSLARWYRYRPARVLQLVPAAYVAARSVALGQRA